MKYSEIFKEARRLHQSGFAVHWLHPRSKRPIEAGWTSGPKKPWGYLAETYIAGLNLGVRTGTPSKIGDLYLAVVDVDVKSTDPRHRAEALAAVRTIFGDLKPPEVRSGRGNGSRHYYILTHETFKTFDYAWSEEQVRVSMPSKKPSKLELKVLTEKEIASGIRIANAWEISFYSDGRQVVLPPSVHPDSGELYGWKRPFTAPAEIPTVRLKAWTPGGVGSSGGVADVDGVARGSEREALQAPERSEGATLEGFEVKDVEIDWLPISDEMRLAIKDGVGVEDRSGFLLKASTALISAGLSQNEVLSVLTDPGSFLGACGYDHAKTKDRGRAAAWIYRYTFKKVKEERSAANVFARVAIDKPRQLTEEEARAQSVELEAERNWRQDLVRGGQNGQGNPQKLVQNVVLILKNEVSPLIVKRDLFAYRDTYDCDTPWGGKKDQIVGDDDVAMIKYWISVHFRFEPTNTTISDALTVIACKNAYDPVKSFLDGLPAWDSKARLDTWLSVNFEAEGHPEYLAQVFRKWMFAMVLRVYEPGAKFDWMPIFEGAQGIGKSSFGRLLVGDKYFLDWLPNLNDKDSALSLQGMWGVEMGELSQFRRNELENIKAFITRTVDKLRPPYGRRLIESPRRCVFFGTTNKDKYLIDETGNRRFKPIIVGNLDFKALRRERVQLFAEAKYLYDQKIETPTTLDLTGEARVFEKKIQSEKMVEDDSNAMLQAMEDFVEKVGRKSTEFNLFKFRILDLFDGRGPLTKWKAENRNLQFAAKMLKKMGAENRFIEGRKYWKVGGSDEKDTPPTHHKKSNDYEDVNFS